MQIKRPEKRKKRSRKKRSQKETAKRENLLRMRGAPSGEFESARRVAVRMMETRAFAKGIEEEDRAMVAYIPNLRRLNELGMITFNSQSGKRETFPHYQTGKRVVSSERAYCYGFVDASVADAVIRWMWDNTDKYVARSLDVDAVSRGDGKLYDALSDFGRIGVTRTECEGVVSWHTRASPVVMPTDYECNYGRFVYPEQRGAPPDALGEEAIKHVGPYKEHPVPRSAVCLLCVDMVLDRLADAPAGLFTQLEAALRATRRAEGPESAEGAEGPRAPKGPKAAGKPKGPKAANPKRATPKPKGAKGPVAKSNPKRKYNSRRAATTSAKRSRRKARGGTRSPCAGARRGRCARSRRAAYSRRARRAGSRVARRS